MGLATSSSGPSCGFQCLGLYHLVSCFPNSASRLLFIDKQPQIWFLPRILCQKSTNQSSRCILDWSSANVHGTFTRHFLWPCNGRRIPPNLYRNRLFIASTRSIRYFLWHRAMAFLACTRYLQRDWPWTCFQPNDFAILDLVYY